MGPVPPLQGGIAQHSKRLVEALVLAGHNVDVISWRDQYPRLLYRGAQRLHDEAGFHAADFMLKWWSVRSWLRARRRAAHSDLLLFPYVTPFLAIPQRVIAGSAGNVTALVHNAQPHERMPFANTLTRLALGSVDHLVVHGDRVASDLRTMRLDPQISVVAMPPTLEVSPTPLPDGLPLRLLFFGFVRPYKGLKIAIEAVGRLDEIGHDVTLTVLGEFWEPVEHHQRLADELGIAEKIDLRPGYATDEELLEALAQHHLVIAPYVSDTLSAVVPVAFAAGRPVVSTRVAGISEQLQDSVNGVLVAPGDPAALATGILAASADIEALARCAAASSATWSAVAAVVAEISTDDTSNSSTDH